MANFASDFGKDLKGKVIPNKDDLLDRKIDFQRDTFLKGISSTKYGKKEDPTYLHFKFIFDFGNTAYMDPETFLAPSPLFRSLDKAASEGDLVNLSGEIKGINPENNQIKDSNYANELANIEKANLGNFKTDLDFFYGSKFAIESRAKQGAFIANGGGVAYYGAQEYLFQRSVKRQQMLEAFKNGISFINEKCPYYFQSLSGLDQLLKVDIKNIHKVGGKPQRMGTLTIDCLESIDMRMFALSELYRKAIYDYTYHRTMLPENLRKFRMWLVVSEIRNIQLKFDMNDVLNPFSIPAVANGANFLDSFNSQTGMLDNTQGLLQKSTIGKQTEYQDKFGSYTMGPYAFIYQLDQCEFDFDDSYPSFATIDNKGLNTPVSSKFKIHVGRVKDYKLQFNELADIMRKDDNIKSMVISDVWGSMDSNYNNMDYEGATGIVGADFSTEPDPAEYFANMASKFITNTVADLKNQGVSILQGALLGNIYGMGGLNIGASTSSAQSLINTLKGGIPNPFADNTPQGKGLGGPSERQYPSMKEDVYPDNTSAANSSLGTAYSAVNGSKPSSIGDIYPTVPGPSQYPKPGGDEYKNVTGSDLGVPGRIYPKIKEDVYPSVPGTIQYPSNNSDEYKDVPGKDLGVPDRLYPSVNDDVYKSVPGEDLGLPNRQYPKVTDDQYPPENPVNTNTLGNSYDNNPPQYPGVIDDQYPSETPVNTNTIGTSYNNITPKYPNVSGEEYDKPVPADPPVMNDVYGNNPYTYPTLIEQRAYKDPDSRRYEPMGDAYSNDPMVNKNPAYSDRVYKDNKFYTMGSTMGDTYPNVPGADLGGAGRSYPGLRDSEYDQVPQSRPTNLGRSYPSS